MKILEHKHLIVRANLRLPPVCVEEILPWMENLVQKIGMKIMMGPYAAYSEMVGNKGLTAVTIIETSHIALHVWDEVDPALMQLDVYTCSSLDPAHVFEAFQCFDPTNFEYKFIDREHNLTLLRKGNMGGEILSI